jgi:hypothetical protein
MLRTFKKFIAVLLAVWLPLFSGNALAMSVAMPTMDGDCPMAAQQGGHDSQQTSAAHQYTQPPHLAAHQDAPAGDCDNHQDQQSSTHGNCGVCQLACCGYMAAATIKTSKAQLLAQLFTPVLTQFQSTTPTPLDHPPLARV